MIRIGFTGSRKNPTKVQLEKLEDMLNDGDEFHHGDCIGSDSAAHMVAMESGCRTIIHPPDIEHLRAHCTGDITHEPLPYLDRNKKIVKDCQMLVALPDGEERMRSGTWSTVRYAVNAAGIPVVIIYPDGKVERR